MKLSVIIPLYNSGKYLSKAVDSVVNQQLGNDYEIVIVNDGSTDDSGDIAEKIALDNKNIKVFTQKNQGPGIARNRGLEEARGEYILFLDADDYLEPDSLSFLLSEAEDKNLDILFYSYRAIFEDGTFSVLALPNHEWNSIVVDGITAIAKFKFIHSVCSEIFKREFVLKTGVKFENQFWGEDVLFIIKLLLQAKRTERVNKVCYNYVRYNIKSLTNSHNKDKSHIKKVTNSRIEVTTKIKAIVNDIEKRDKSVDIECLQVLKDAVSVFSQCAIYKLVQAGYTTGELRIKLNEMQQSGIYPIGDRKEYPTVRDKILKILLNHKWMIFFLNKVL